MTYDPDELQVEIDGLRHEIKIAETNLTDFSRRMFNKDREKAVIYCLARGCELGRGCEYAARSTLIAPLYALTRALYESLLWICWITTSEANAQRYIQSPRVEMKRIIRKALNTGHGRLVDNATGDDAAPALLASDWAKDIGSRISIEEVAKDCGLEKVHIRLYGLLSIQTHGASLDLKLHSDPKEEVTTVCAIANVLMECVNLVASNWISKRKATPASDLFAILRL